MYYYTKFEDFTFNGDRRAFPAVYFVGHGHEAVAPYLFQVPLFTHIP